jgi:hypothetical protein
MLASAPDMAARTSQIPLAGAVVLAALAMLFAFAPLRADDAYIVARYAIQWWHGHGLVFNAGERVNMLTSPLHTWVAIALGGAVAAYQAIAAAIVVATLAAIAWRRKSLLFLVLTLASPALAFWTVGGLETPLLLAICAVIAYLATKASPTRNDLVATVVLCALAVFTRYDAVAFVAPIGLACVLRDRRALVAALVCATSLAAWIGWTKSYYGDVLPTSFYVKAAGFGWRDLGLGVVYAASFLVLSLAWVPWLRARDAAAAPLRRALLLGLALEFAYAIFAGTRHMMYLYRLFVPYLPALVLAATPLARYRSALVAACLAWQAAFACFIYAQSENPSLALLATNDDVFEFERLGARHTATFLDTIRAQAPAIAAHWLGPRPPRIVVSTGGILPYELPDAYVLEVLASYRHRCRPDIAAMADYQQVIYPAGERSQVEAARRASGQSLVAGDVVVADGLRPQPLPLAVQVWFVPNPAPLTLPPSIGGDCTTGELPSPPRK